MFETTTQGAVSIISGDSPLKEDFLLEFMESFEDLLTIGQPMSVLDMSGISLIDREGLEMLMDLQDKFYRRGGCLKLAAANPLCSDILRVTNVEERFEVFDRLIDAVGSFVK